MEGRIYQVQRNCLQDGPGSRTTVYLAGCSLTCPWCRAPESQWQPREAVTTAMQCLHCGASMTGCNLGEDPCLGCGDGLGTCAPAARAGLGWDVQPEELVADLLRDRGAFQRTGGGVTFSGGEPLAQTAFVAEVLGALRTQGIHTALNTSGCARWKDLLRASALADLVLFDLMFMDDRRHKAYTGRSNGRILDNLRALARVHPAIWLRVPVIPGGNDDEDNLRAVAAFAAGMPAVQRVELRRFQGPEVARFDRLALNPLVEPEPASAGLMAAAAAAFRLEGLEVTVG